MNSMWIRLVLILSVLATLQEATVNGKSVKDAGGFPGSKSILVTSSSADSVYKTVSNAEEGSVVVLAMESLTLTEPLLPAKGVTVQGAASEPRINCSSSDAPAFLIQNEGITLQDFIIEECKGSGVVVEPLENEQQMNVTIVGVKFYENGSPVGSGGGAVRIKGPSNLNIQNCKFRGNVGLRGGAIYGDNSSVVVRDSVFNGNNATLGGGAIFAQDLGSVQASMAGISIVSSRNVVEIESCIFEGNIVAEIREDPIGLLNILGAPMENVQFLLLRHPSTMGGSVFTTGLQLVSILGSRFANNTAASGGAIYLGKNAENRISNCQFSGNAARSGPEGKFRGHRISVPLIPNSGSGIGAQGAHGGAVYAASTITNTIVLSECEFSENYAAYGGAVHVVGPKFTRVIIEESKFYGNNATIAGGAILIRNTANSRVQASTISNNNGKSGGGMLLANGAEAMVSDTQFGDNHAIEGGGLMCFGAGVVLVESSSFSGNDAIHFGGAAAFLESIGRAPAAFQSTIFHDNHAAKGGAIYLDKVSELNVRGKSEFSRNSALSGGAVLMITESSVKNEVSILGANFTGNVADERACENRGWEGENACMELKLGDIGHSCGLGGGGGVCLVLNQLPRDAPAFVEIRGAAFDGNIATKAGGDMCFLTKGRKWQETCGDGYLPGFQPCRTIHIINPKFEINNEKFGGVFTNDQTAIYIAYNAPAIGVPPFERLDLYREFAEKGSL